MGNGEKRCDQVNQNWYKLLYLLFVIGMTAILLLISLSDFISSLALPIGGIVVGLIGIITCKPLGRSAANYSFYVYLFFLSGSVAAIISYFLFPELDANLQAIVNVLFIIGASFLTLIQANSGEVKSG